MILNVRDNGPLLHILAVVRPRCVIWKLYVLHVEMLERLPVLRMVCLVVHVLDLQPGQVVNSIETDALPPALLLSLRLLCLLCFPK